MATGPRNTKADSALNSCVEFRDPALEALYRRTMQSNDACQLRIALLMVASLFLAFSLSDYSLVSFSDTFTMLLAMRITVAAACLVVAWAVWQRPSLAQRALPINIVCLISLSGLLLTIPLKPDSTGIHLASMVVASMVLYLFVPNRLPWILGWNAYLFVGFIIANWLWASVPPGMMATGLLLLGFVNLLGWFTLSRLSRLQREQFASLLEEREANRQLHAEIAERTQLEKQLRQMASTDDLTGIANRRHFFELAERELRRARRDDTPLAICMVDIDLFKNLNDRHGHAVGDRVLTAVAACCQSVLRETDLIGRYGGEEFVIALPQANLHTAAAIAERLRDKVTRLSLPVVDGSASLSVTVGVSLVGKDELRLDDALLRADKALYKGKARGRNCVVVAPEAPRVVPTTHHTEDSPSPLASPSGPGITDQPTPISATARPPS